MSKYIAYVNQTDNGCDYTIACGKVMVELGATSLDGAIDELKEYYRERSWPDGFESITLYRAAEKHEMPLNVWQKEVVDEEQKRVLAEQEREEREQYERLRARYG